MLLHSFLAAMYPGWGGNVGFMMADIGPLLQLKQEVSAFYQSLANQRDNVQAHSGGQDRKPQLPHYQNNASLTWPAVFNPSVQELRIHLQAHVLTMEKLLGSNPDLVSAYHLCDKHLQTIMEAFEAEKAIQQQAQHAANDPTVTVNQSRLFRSGQDVDLHGRPLPTGLKPLPVGLRPPVRARSPSAEEIESPAKKAKTQSCLVAVGTEIMQERMYSRASHGLPGPWQAEESPSYGHHLFPGERFL